MKKYSLFLLLALPLFVGCTAHVPTTFRLHGQLKDMGRQEVIMRYNGIGTAGIIRKHGMVVSGLWVLCVWVDVCLCHYNRYYYASAKTFGD